MLSNQTLNRETQSIIVLMAMILENNDLAAPILILQLLKVAVVVGSVEVRIPIFYYKFYNTYLSLLLVY